MGHVTLTILLTVIALGIAVRSVGEEPKVLPGTKPLMTDGDIAAHMVAGVDRFLLR